LTVPAKKKGGKGWPLVIDCPDQKVLNLLGYLTAGIETYAHLHRKLSQLPFDHGRSKPGWQTMFTLQPTTQMIQTSYFDKSKTLRQLATKQHTNKNHQPMLQCWYPGLCSILQPNFDQHWETHHDPPYQHFTPYATKKL